MDPMALLVTAPAIGAAKGVGETATAAVIEAYGGFKVFVAARLSGEPARELVLSEHENQPQVWQATLTRAVTDRGAAADVVIFDAAPQLLEMLGIDGAQCGKHAVDLWCAAGVQMNYIGGSTPTSAPTVLRQVP